MRYLLLAAFVALAYGQFDPNNAPNRQAMVHLFEWRWDDIADECERFLGPKGYAGVQVSPPTENAVVVQSTVTRPWWERYQVVSYKLFTRSGTEEQFQDMVTRCNAAGVRVYVDAVLNHMTGDQPAGAGSGGSYYDYQARRYDGVPYSAEHFTPREKCSTASGSIEDFQDPAQVRNCMLLGLADLDQTNEHVRSKQVELLNRLIGYGVAGFRFDASKHMWPEDLRAISASLNDLPTSQGFAAGSRPFIYQEVIDLGGEPITVNDYTDIGRVTEFKYGKLLGGVFEGSRPLSDLANFGEEWGMTRSDLALAFVDNHDNQRGHGAGSDSIVTFREPRLYKMTVGFMLAWPYGFTRVMSSFNWPQNIVNGEDQNNWMGPPHEEDWSISHVTINEDGSCAGDWVCEHRWNAIANMVQFRNVVQGTAVTSWWDNGNNQIAFCRGDKGFVAINNDSTDMNDNIDACLPPGVYCDVISGAKVNGQCTGKTVEVRDNGRAHVQIATSDNDGIVAIHVDAML